MLIFKAFFFFNFTNCLLVAESKNASQVQWDPDLIRQQAIITIITW